jgi:hypothetical protein
MDHGKRSFLMANSVNFPSFKEQGISNFFFRSSLQTVIQIVILIVNQTMRAST